MLSTRAVWSTNTSVKVLDPPFLFNRYHAAVQCEVQLCWFANTSAKPFLCNPWLKRNAYRQGAMRIKRRIHPPFSSVQSGIHRFLSKPWHPAQQARCYAHKTVDPSALLALIHRFLSKPWHRQGAILIKRWIHRPFGPVQDGIHCFLSKPWHPAQQARCYA